MNRNTTVYTTNTTYWNGKNLLEITPFKQNGCGLFPQQNICEKDNTLSSCFSCKVPGFHGRPVLFEYSPDTLPNWKSGRCNNINSATKTSCCKQDYYPSVL